MCVVCEKAISKGDMGRDDYVPSRITDQPTYSILRAYISMPAVPIQRTINMRVSARFTWHDEPEFFFFFFFFVNCFCIESKFDQ